MLIFETVINQEYISLINVEPLKNKWRSYAIQITINSKMEGSYPYKVLCAWGRMNKYQRKLTKNFSEESEMLLFLESLFKRRHRNNYKIISKSEKFPHSPTLLKIPITNNIAGQLRLF